MPICVAQRGDLQIAHVLAVDPNGAPGYIVKSRNQVGQRGFSPAARTHQRHHFAGAHFQANAAQSESVGRVLIVEVDVVQHDRMLEFAELRRARLFDNLLIAIQVFEDFLRSAQGLLEDVVNAGEALYGFIQHQQRDDEAGEFAGRQGAALDLDARVAEQADDGESAEAFDERRRERLLRNVAQVAGFESRGGHAEAVGFHVLGAERFHHLMPADGFLQDLIEIGGLILRPAGGPADAAADAQRGHQHERQQREADQSQPPVLLDHHAQQEDHGESLAHPIRQHMRGSHLDLFDVVHDGRHHAAGGVGFEEMGVLPQHLVEYGLAQIGDRRDADIVDEIVAEIIARPFDDERGDDGDGHHGPDVMDGGR